LTTTQDSHRCPATITAAGPAACTAWSDFVNEPRFRPSTRDFYRRAALRFLHWLEPQRSGVPQVRPGTVEAFLAGLALGQPGKSQYRTALRRFFDTLVAHGVIPFNPANEADLGGDEVLELSEQIAKTLTAVENEIAQLRNNLRMLEIQRERLRTTQSVLLEFDGKPGVNPP
jgi:site-specific recombinase XerD